MESDKEEGVEMKVEECKDAVEKAVTEIVAWKENTVKTEQLGEEYKGIVDIVKMESDIEGIDTEDMHGTEIEEQEAAMVKTEIKEEEDIHIIEVGETEIVAMAPAVVRTETVGRKENKQMNKEKYTGGAAEEQDGEGSSSSKKLQPRRNPREYEHGHKCNMCQRQFTRKHHLLAHLRTHTAEKPCECDVCHFRFKNKDKLERHLRTHTGEKPYECCYCPYTFSQLDAFTSHITTHNTKKPYECHICQKRFYVKSTFIGHLKAHTVKKLYECDFCQRKFPYKRVLKAHLRSHTGEKPHECHVCQKRFYNTGKLNSHLKTHSGEKPYECHVCQKRFFSKSSVVRHLRTHTGEKPHESRVCQKRFFRKSNLIRHLRTHTGEKPYGCDVCQKRFFSKSSVIRHLRTHTGEKPYECDICQYKSYNKGDFIRHLRTHIPPNECADIPPLNKPAMMPHLKVSDVVTTDMLGEEDIDIINKIQVDEHKIFVKIAKTKKGTRKADIIETEQEEINTEDMDNTEIERQEAAKVKTEIKEEEDIHIVEVGETEIVAVAPTKVRTKAKSRTKNKRIIKDKDIGGVAEGKDGEGSSSSEKLQPWRGPRGYELRHPCHLCDRQFISKDYRPRSPHTYAPKTYRNRRLLTPSE